MAARSSACRSASLSRPGDLDRGFGVARLPPAVPAGVPPERVGWRLAAQPTGVDGAGGRGSCRATALLPRLAESGLPPLPTTWNPSSDV